MYCSTLQDWVTISGNSSTTTITQAEAAWMDLSDFQDIIAWLEVKEVSAGGGSGVQLAYQTAPTKDEMFFAPIVGALTVATGPTITIMRKASIATPLSQWLRWQLTATGSVTSAWHATFRLFISASASGCRRPAMPGAPAKKRAAVPLASESSASARRVVAFRLVLHRALRDNRFLAALRVSPTQAIRQATWLTEDQRRLFSQTHIELLARFAGRAPSVRLGSFGQSRSILARSNVSPVDVMSLGQFGADHIGSILAGRGLQQVPSVGAGVAGTVSSQVPLVHSDFRPPQSLFAGGASVGEVSQVPLVHSDLHPPQSPFAGTASVGELTQVPFVHPSGASPLLPFAGAGSTGNVTATVSTYGRPPIGAILRGPAPVGSMTVNVRPPGLPQVLPAILQPPPNPTLDIQWAQADSYAIRAYGVASAAGDLVSSELSFGKLGQSSSSTYEYWWAGRVTDVLMTRGRLIAATSNGGLWSVSEDNPPFGPPGAAIPEADFGPPNFNSIVEDKSVPGRIFAAGDALFVKDPGWKAVSLPPKFGTINKIDTYVDKLTNTPRLVLATTTGPSPFTANFSSVVASGSHVVAATAGTAGVGTGVFFGDWFDDVLVMQGAQVTSTFLLNYQAAYLGRDVGDPTRQLLYMAVEGPNQTLVGVWKSKDGGKTWTSVTPGNPTGIGPRSRPGCIEACNNVIALGWLRLLISSDGGSTWTVPHVQHSGVSFNPDVLHDDTNSVRFFGRDQSGLSPAEAESLALPTFPTLFVCTDGGLFSTDGFGGGNWDVDTTGVGGVIWHSGYNKHLLNLMVQSPSQYGGAFPGSMAASLAVPDGVFLGLQDNGTVRGQLAPSGGGYWVGPPDWLGGCDGTYVAALSGDLLGMVVYTPYCGVGSTRYSFSSEIHPSNPRENKPFVANVGMVAVVFGEVKNSGPKPPTMFAVAAGFAAGGQPGVRDGAGKPGDQGLIFGVFAEENNSLVALIPIAKLDVGPWFATPPTTTITAIFCDNEARIFVGTANGNIFRFDPGASGSYSGAGIFEQVSPLVTGNGAVVIKFAQTKDGRIFAAYSQQGYTEGTGVKFGAVLRRVTVFGTPGWMAVGADVVQDRLGNNNSVIRSICADDGNRVFVATTSSIFACDSTGLAWWRADRGLPFWSNCADIVFARDPGAGQRYLYLGTHGRSVWRATVPPLGAAGQLSASVSPFVLAGP